MIIFSSDFDEKIYDTSYDIFNNEIFSEKEIIEMTEQANEVIKNENEEPEKKAKAYVRKFQLLKLQYKLAPKLLEKALELCPDMPEALTQMGSFYYLTKDKEKAQVFFSKAIKYSASYPFVWLEIAHCSQQENDIKNANDYYLKYIRLKRDSIIGYEMRFKNLYNILYDRLVITQRKLKTRESPKFARYIETAFNDVNELIRIQPDNFKHYQKRIQLRFWNYKINFNKNISQPGANIINDFKTMILLYSDKELIKENRLDLHDIAVFTHNVLHELSSKTRNDIWSEIIKALPTNKDATWLVNYLIAYDCELEKRIMLYDKIIKKYKKNNLIKLYAYIDRAILYGYFAESFFSSKLYSDIFDFKNAVNILTDTLNYLKRFDVEEYNDRKMNIYYARGQFYEYEDKPEEALKDYLHVISLWKNGTYCNKIKTVYEACIRMYRKIGKTEEAFSEFLEMWDLKDDGIGLDDFIPDNRKYVILDTLIF